MHNNIFDCLVIPSPSFSQHETLVREARTLARRVVTNNKGTRFDEAELLAFINDANADAVIAGTDPLSATVIERLENVKAVGKFGVGCDNVDIEALHRNGIYFGWEGGVNRRSVAELALGFMLGHQRNIFRSIDRTQRSTWKKDGGFQLTGKTVGIIGFGFIGTDLASLLAPFKCNLVVHDIIDKSEQCLSFSARQIPYDDLLRSADIVTFHVPGGDVTRNMFGEGQIDLVRPSALVINTARGSIVDFNAVSKAVQDGRIGAYASDVFPEEPLISSSFKIEDGFYFTPHIGGNADEAILAMGRSAIRGLKSFLASASANNK